MFRLLSYLNVACIREHTFYDHQNKYLEPAIIVIWNIEQPTLLSECKSPLSIGGDGRVVSPGHSAKYGSYGIIDLNTNKVLHIELVH